MLCPQVHGQSPEPIDRTNFFQTGNEPTRTCGEKNDDMEKKNEMATNSGIFA